MDTLGLILDTKIIAISRGNYGEGLIKSVEALYRAGVRAVEVTFEAGRELGLTASAIAALADRFSERMAVGAGTVVTLKQLECAYKSGASYIVSPNADPNIIGAAKELGLVSIPGAMTPTEIMLSHTAGADIVKVFPAGMLGAEYFKAIRAPFPNIKLAAVAGITIENIAGFADAGACAFGISSGLFNQALIASGRYSEIEANAKKYIDAANVNRNSTKN